MVCWSAAGRGGICLCFWKSNKYLSSVHFSVHCAHAYSAVLQKGRQWHLLARFKLLPDNVWMFVFLVVCVDSFGSNHFLKSYILLISQFVHWREKKNNSIWNFQFSNFQQQQQQQADGLYAWGRVLLRKRRWWWSAQLAFHSSSQYLCSGDRFPHQIQTKPHWLRISLIWEQG